MRRNILTVSFAALLASALPSNAHEPGSDEFNQAIRDYLLANPQILGEMQAAFDAKQQELAEEAQAQALAENSDRIFRSPHDLVLGNPNGDVTIVEFYDYNCGFCARAMQDMQTVIEADANVRFVLKEFPILGPNSTDAHVVSMAVGRVAPEKYGEFHQRLLGLQESKNAEVAARVASELGIDLADLEAAMVDPAEDEAFAEAYSIARSLQISGTPAYVVGDSVVFGAQGANELLAQVKKAREKVSN